MFLLYHFYIFNTIKLIEQFNDLVIPHSSLFINHGINELKQLFSSLFFRIIFICSLCLADMVRVSNTFHRVDIEVLTLYERLPGERNDLVISSSQGKKIALKQSKLSMSLFANDFSLLKKNDYFNFFPKGLWTFSNVSKSTEMKWLFNQKKKYVGILYYKNV